MSCLDCPDYKEFCDGEGLLTQVRLTTSGNYVSCHPDVPCPQKFPDRYPLQSNVTRMQDGQQVSVPTETMSPEVIPGQGILLVSSPVETPIPPADPEPDMKEKTPDVED